MPDVGTAVSATSVPPTGAAPKARPHPEGSVKDTVESILVAFILAFVFRAFVVEAFVIPTGSMAPTLLGAHMRFTCDDCGYRYTVNFPTDGDLSVPPNAPPLRQPVFCPNCGFAVPAGPGTDQSVPDTRTRPPVHYGDRILVLKYRYLLSEPRRWDVVVFKAPDAVSDAPPFTTNFIKRLIGNPGESVMMVDGDIYISAAKPDGDLEDDATRESFFRTFTVQGKPNHAQEALWRLVYDNDHIPHRPDSERTDSLRWTQPWTLGSGTGWNVGQDLPMPGRSRVFTFANDSGGGNIRFDPEANPNPDPRQNASTGPMPFAMTDFLAYDQISTMSNGNARSLVQSMVGKTRNRVSDLRLKFFYTRQSGDGALELLLTKREDVFVARLTPGKAELIWKRANGDIVKSYPAVAVPALAGSGPVDLDFTNVDYRVSLRVGQAEVLSTGTDYNPTGDQLVALIDEERGRSGRPYPKNARVEIAADRQSCRLEHISLWRDLFYVNDENPGRLHDEREGITSKPLKGSPRDIMTLGPDEFFVMGDNPWISSDARAWDNRVELPGENLFVDAGRVPRRFLLGKAFFVYWPAGYRPPVLDWGVVPNFGDMRFIH